MGRARMALEQKRKIAERIAVLVAVAGMIVIGGWIFNMGSLKSLSPAWVSMKFDTAVAFVLSGLTLFFIARARESGSDAAPVVLSITSLMILLLMGTLFFSAILGVHTGLEELFIRDADPAPTTVAPGQPSLPTILNFIWIAIAAIMTVLNPEKLAAILKNTGLIVGVTGAVAVMGYLVNVPLLYYFIPGINCAMACHTAVLFMLLGIGFLCL